MFNLRTLRWCCMGFCFGLYYFIGNPVWAGPSPSLAGFYRPQRDVGTDTKPLPAREWRNTDDAIVALLASSATHADPRPDDPTDSGLSGPSPPLPATGPTTAPGGNAGIRKVAENPTPPGAVQVTA